MGNNDETERNFSFRFKIDNFSEKKDTVKSQTFVIGGCEWFLRVDPNDCPVYMGLYLFAENPSSVEPGWYRTTTVQFVVLNQSDKVLYRSRLQPYGFHRRNPVLACRKTLPFRELQGKGFLENDILIVQVFITVDANSVGVDLDKKGIVDINGFQVLASKATSVRKLFAEHPDVAENFRPKNQLVKTNYMNILLNLVETFENPLLQNHSEKELRIAYGELNELMEQGFKLEWLKSKLGEVSLKRKKPDTLDVQQLNERVKNLELMEQGLMLECLKSTLDVDADVQQLNERVKTLELMNMDSKLNSLIGKLDVVSLERKKAEDHDGCRVKEMDERIKNLEIMVSDLKAKLDKQEAESSADGFLLVDEAAFT